MPYMDKTPTVPTTTLRDGFTGQRFLVVPDPTVREALGQPVTRYLLVSDAGFFPKAHRHARSRPEGAEQHVFMVCTAGRGTVVTPEGKFAVSKGDAVLLPARVEHEYFADAHDPWTLWWFHVTGRDSDELFSAALESVGGPVAHLRDVAPFASLVSQIIDGLESATNGGLMRAAGCAWQVLTHTIASGKRPPGEVESPVDRALSYLQASAPERISVEELAALVGLGTSQFSALFRAQVGMPPLRYQNELRLSRARELLDTTSMSVAEVADACGYDDALYFSRQFAKFHGVSPTSYRSRAL